MTSLVTLLARNQRLLERLEEGPGNMSATKSGAFWPRSTKGSLSPTKADRASVEIAANESRHTLPPRGGSHILLEVSNS